METCVVAEPTKTPSERLAHRIVERLVAEEVLTREEGDKLLPRLGPGTASGEDWRLALENTDLAAANDDS